jgi:hypothetical protein
MGSNYSERVDVVEEKTSPPGFSIVWHDQSVNVSGSTLVQIGNNNTQSVQLDFQKTILTEIEKANAPEKTKQEAKSLLVKLSENALLASIIGALLSAGITPTH